MSLVTRCPACNMVFHVVQDQLKVSGGWVRCGHCDEVFNALENLFEAEHLPERTPGQMPTVGQDNTLRLRDPVGTASEFDSRLYSDFGTTSLLPSHFGPDAGGTLRRAPTWDLDQLLKPRVSPPADTASETLIEVPAPSAATATATAELAPPSAAPASADTTPATAEEAPTAEASTTPDIQPATAPAPFPHWIDTDSPLPASATLLLHTPSIHVPPLPEPPAPARQELPQESGISEFPSTVAVLEEELPSHRITQGLHLFDPPTQQPSTTTSATQPYTAAASVTATDTPAPAATAAPLPSESSNPSHHPHEGSPDASALPAFMRSTDAPRQPWPRNPLMRWLLILLVPLLVLALILQMVVQQRNELAINYVGLRPLLLKLCGVAGCQLESPRMIDQIVLVSSQLQQTGTPGVLQLSAELHNRARHPVLTPAMDLRLNDAYGQLLARRVITPQELGATASDLQPSGSWPVSVHLEVGSLPVAGFSLELFYP